MGGEGEVVWQAFEGAIDDGHCIFRQAGVLGVLFRLVLGLIEFADEEGPGGVVDLQVAATKVIEVLDRFPVGRGEVG